MRKTILLAASLAALGASFGAAAQGAGASGDMTPPAEKTPGSPDTQSGANPAGAPGDMKGHGKSMHGHHGPATGSAMTGDNTMNNGNATTGKGAQPPARTGPLPAHTPGDNSSGPPQ